MRAAIAERVPHAERLRFWVEHPGRVLTTLHLLRLSCVLSVGRAAWALASTHAPRVHASVLVAARGARCAGGTVEIEPRREAPAS